MGGSSSPPPLMTDFMSTIKYVMYNKINNAKIDMKNLTLHCWTINSAITLGEY